MDYTATDPLFQQNLQAFYPPGSVEQIAQRVIQSGSLQRLAAEWKLPVELASDLVKIALFDVVVLVDDSGSMAFEQAGERIEDLKMWVDKLNEMNLTVSQDPRQSCLCVRLI